jgi:NADPH-dependent curcumin reductase CurA
MSTNLQARIRRLPQEAVQATDFELHEGTVPTPGIGEVLVHNHYLSLDPYMRKRLADAVAGRVTLRPGDLMMGRTVGEVVSSRSPSFHPGDQVLGWGGWQQYSSEDATSLERVDPVPDTELSVHLGALGRPGITAWLGIVHVAAIRSGECVVVSSAAGAVGSLAAQMARHLGAQVVGITGSPAKCAAVVQELGLHACVDYKSPEFADDLAASTPDGVDAGFENVGAAVLDATLDRMKRGARIAVCGLLGHYHSGPAYGFRNLGRLLERGLRLQGFNIDASAELHQSARADLRAWLESGAIRRWETVTQGLAGAPTAFVDMLQGRGQGKTLVRLL